MFLNLLRWFSFNFRYIVKPPWDTGIPAPELIHFIQNNSAGKALDLGCGTGTNMLALLKAGWDVDGVEFALIPAWKALKKIREYGDSGTVYFRNASKLEILCDNRYDLILDIGCYHSLPADEKIEYQNQILRLLVENGTFLMYTFLKQPGRDIGINQREIDQFKDFLTLISRQDGKDNGDRLSVWLTFQK